MTFMDDQFRTMVDGVFEILKEKFYNEATSSIKNFQDKRAWGDVKIEMEINFQDGQIKRVTSGCSSQDHVRANNESRN